MIEETSTQDEVDLYRKCHILLPRAIACELEALGTSAAVGEVQYGCSLVSQQRSLLQV